MSPVLSDLSLRSDSTCRPDAAFEAEHPMPTPPRRALRGRLSRRFGSSNQASVCGAPQREPRRRRRGARYATRESQGDQRSLSRPAELPDIEKRFRGSCSRSIARLPAGEVVLVDTSERTKPERASQSSR
jgi:hypothetical protein